MAGYEKQQQQPQMSAPYYAYPAPQQPAYYAPPPPPPAPRRSGPGCFLCFIFKIIAIAVIALGALTIVLWLILRPRAVRATAVSATLSRFDLADGPSAGGQLLQYNLTVDIRVRNPNRQGIHYDYAEAQASYDGERFGYDPVDPFYLERKGERTVTAAFGGSSLVNDGGALRSYRREKSDGFYSVKVRLYADLSFKVRVFNARRKSKISCTLRLPVPNTSATPVTTQLGTRCSVGF
ncbi:NDR1/HIN1-like protein 10 [Lolium rigidum]|uniref:NDR1/HIN1-like protein 10 n=1 Tax=Lolium rigidum TaxID=89674 RepID=UPI001F5C3DFA|nr:NDR1/HIN1-like protein 10 [Lolium rigidum]